MKLKSILLTAVATLGLTTASMAQVPNYVPTNGLVGWWPFNGNANDESGNGNNGTVNGAIITSDRLGNTNSAYNFNGVNNSITVPDNSSNDINGDFTIAAWINCNPGYGSGTGSINNQIVNKWGAGGSGLASFQLCISPTGVPKVYVNDGSTTSGVISNLIIPINSWHYLITKLSGQTLKLYIDGFQVDSINNSVVPQSSVYNLNFGQEEFGNISFFNGKLDDIGIWNRALTQQEITDLYNGGICYQNITVTDTLLINMGITGFNPVTYNNTIRIYPNPANDHITIDYGDFASLNGYQLKIINSLSQQVFQTNIIQKSNYLNLTTWGGNGLYFVQIIDPQGNIIDIRKIVLQ